MVSLDQPSRTLRYAFPEGFSNSLSCTSIQQLERDKTTITIKADPAVAVMPLVFSCASLDDAEWCAPACVCVCLCLPVSLFLLKSSLLDSWSTLSVDSCLETALIDCRFEQALHSVSNPVAASDVTMVCVKYKAFPGSAALLQLSQAAAPFDVVSVSWGTMAGYSAPSSMLFAEAISAFAPGFRPISLLASSSGSMAVFVSEAAAARVSDVSQYEVPADSLYQLQLA